MQSAEKFEPSSIPDFCTERNSIVKTKLLTRVWQLAGSGPIALLDAGCGNGSWVAPLLENMPAIDYFGLEPSSSAIDKARLNIPRFASQLQVGRGEDIAATFGKQFDIVISQAVLEHVYHRDAFIDEVCRSVKPGGTLLLTYGSNHFKQGLRTDLRNLISQILARLGTDRYYAKEVDEPHFLQRMRTNGMSLRERKRLSFRDVKQVHKLIADTPAGRGALLEWLALEERFNAEVNDPADFALVTDQAYFEARRED